jgi:hypothetical protein
MEEIKKILNEFKCGIEYGDDTIGGKLIARNAGPLSEALSVMFPQLCQMLQTQYKGRELPMEIERIKILRNGKAKAATQITEEKSTLVFTLIQEEGEWRISHFEGILFPLFDPPNTPYHDVLKLEDKIRSSISAENELAFLSKVFKEREKQTGKEYAQQIFLDGAGYRIAMDSWLPFFEGPEQYIIYTAIMETNLRGSNCTVTEINEEQATLVMEPLAHLEVIQRAALNPKLSYNEYTDLYTVITQDRAKHCNLNISIDFNGNNCTITAKQS